jgi:hypothetical protein
MKKHFRYLCYVAKHKWYVFIACWNLGIIWHGIVHDLSKFRLGEWIAYTEYFYGNKNKFGVKEAFDAAWLKHIHRNPHHWQYWILRCDTDGKKIIPMPEKYVKEMIADWAGAGMAINGEMNPRKWYLENYYNIQLAPKTRRFVDHTLEVEGPPERVPEDANIQ